MSFYLYSIYAFLFICKFQETNLIMQSITFDLFLLFWVFKDYVVIAVELVDSLSVVYQSGKKRYYKGENYAYCDG